MSFAASIQFMKTNIAKTKARERALIHLYQEAVDRDSDILEENMDSDIDLEFFQRLLSEALKNQEGIRQEINLESSKAKFKGQNKIDQAILTLALVEINFFDENPSIVINESLELAKKYSTIESKNIIHSFLDKYVGGKK